MTVTSNDTNGIREMMVASAMTEGGLGLPIKKSGGSPCTKIERGETGIEIGSEKEPGTMIANEARTVIVIVIGRNAEVLPIKADRESQAADLVHLLSRKSRLFLGLAKKKWRSAAEK